MNRYPEKFSSGTGVPGDGIPARWGNSGLRRGCTRRRPLRPTRPPLHQHHPRRILRQRSRRQWGTRDPPPPTPHPRQGMGPVGPEAVYIGDRPPTPPAPHLVLPTQHPRGRPPHPNTEATEHGTGPPGGATPEARHQEGTPGQRGIPAPPHEPTLGAQARPLTSMGSTFTTEARARPGPHNPCVKHGLGLCLRIRLRKPPGPG